jgi:hypothetical protein
MKRYLFITAAALSAAAQLHAVMGVGDVVIVASNPAQELLWATEELPKWVEMIGKAQEQVNKAQEMVEIVGHPEKFAGKILNSAVPALAVTRDANALKAEKEVLDFTRASWTLFKSADRSRDDVLSVDDNYRVFGKQITRDRGRYLNMAMEKALRARVKEAVLKKKKVDEQELNFQQATLDALKSARAETEIALHQAGLDASKQRMDLAGARVKQAETELATFLGDKELDQRKDQELAKEWAENATEEALKFVVQAREGAVGSVPDRVMTAKEWNAASL